MGPRQKRISNEEAKEFVAEFMGAAKKCWPKILVQYKGFDTDLTFDLLEEWRDKHTCFNDDVLSTWLY
jgi:malic enzyme